MQHLLYREYQRLSRLDKKRHLHARRRFNRQWTRYLEGGFTTNDWWNSQKMEILNAIRNSGNTVSYVPGPNEWEHTHRLYVRYKDGTLNFEIELEGDEDVETEEFGSDLIRAVQTFARNVRSTENEVVACLLRNIGVGLAVLERARDEEVNEYAPTVRYE